MVKLFKLRSSVTRSSDKRKSKEDGKTIENAFKTSLNKQALVLWGEQNGQSHDERNDPDDSEISENESIFSDNESQTSSASEILSASEISELPVDFYKGHASPEGIDFLFHDSDSVNSHLNDDYSFEHALSQHVDQYDELISSEDETNALMSNEDHIVDVRHIAAFPEEDIEQEFEFSMDLDARDYMRGLSALTNGLADVDVEDPSQYNINDPEHVFQYSFRFLLYVIFALSRSRNYLSPSLLK